MDYRAARRFIFERTIARTEAYGHSDAEFDPLPPGAYRISLTVRFAPPDLPPADRQAIHAANDGASATVIVRRDGPLRYEVWNGSAFCN